MLEDRHKETYTYRKESETEIKRALERMEMRRKLARPAKAKKKVLETLLIEPSSWAIQIDTLKHIFVTGRPLKELFVTFFRRLSKNEVPVRRNKYHSLSWSQEEKREISQLWGFPCKSQPFFTYDTMSMIVTFVNMFIMNQWRRGCTLASLWNRAFF